MVSKMKICPSYILKNLYEYNDKINIFLKLKNEIKMTNNMTMFPNKLLEFKAFFDKNIEFYRIKNNKAFYDRYLFPLNDFEHILKNHPINFTNIKANNIKELKKDLNKTKNYGFYALLLIFKAQ
jgi:hypothetical protein